MSGAPMFGMRNPADVRTIGIVMSKMIIFALFWRLSPNLPLILWLAMFCLQVAINFCVATMVHNAMHCDVFCSKIVEIGWRIILCGAFGFPVEAFKPTHNQNHHVYTQHEKDHLHTTQMTYKIPLVNLLLFFPTVFPAIQRLESEYFSRERAKMSTSFLCFVAQAIVAHGCTLSYIYCDWRRGLLCWFLPNVIAVDFIITMNLLQHDGCTKITLGDHRGEKCEINSARNFTGSLLNWLTCNNGYHQVHHMYSNTHWSQYPALHKTLCEPFCDPALNEPCITSYLWRTYFWPGLGPVQIAKASVDNKKASGHATNEESTNGDVANGKHPTRSKAD
eukprot:TRINITY_DN3750_c0_g1_i2.p1 TRINITY_DN3750_c0_g1~~TRINITY_DN3750_c0_g1_i2.p1  ORF type:complete len:355 (-),score=39.45 TRINITY_DN3750_c0_g1_i2:79-1080(-)